MRRALACAAVVALGLTAAPACSHPSHRPRATPVAAESSPPPEPLTPETAAKAFRAFVADDDVARATGDERLGMWWSSEGQSQLTAAAFRVALDAGDPVPRFRYGNPELYVPKLKPDGAQWFVAKVRRTMLDGKDPQTAIMGFVRSKSNERWRLSLSTLLDKKQKLPKLAVDAEGYAKPLATFDSDLLIPPRLVSSIQATLAEEGPGNVAAKVMTAGKHTTSFYTSDQKITKAKKADDLRATAVYATTSYPIFPLATADGDAIVLYALSRNAVFSEINKKKPGHVPIPKDAAPFVDPKLVHGILDVTQMMQFIAVVPAKPKKDTETPKAEIIGSDSATIGASAPTH
jgi:hypothetical protein